MPLSAGDKLGPYQILSLLGKGGMGEVYKAHDSRLNRDVAIKVSKAEFSERFEREARAVAALNHPNICTLHDVGPNYLVMELIDGTPLKGPMPLDQALKYAVQICDALAAAHKKGITHRDLKPANILVTKAGVKLLDFGLAKFAHAAPPAGTPDDATVTMPLTGKNEILGTLYYMSPEQLQSQANGQEIDGRSDIFSFGLVLYEMLTGKRMFEGSSPASVIAAIMERPAPSIAAIAPPALDRVLQRCLAKDRDERWQSAKDLRTELEWAASASGEAAPAAVSRRGLLPWIAAAVLALALAVVSLIAFRGTTRPAELKRLVQLDVDLGADVSLPTPESASNVAISPDGTLMAYVSGTAPGTTTKLFIRRLDQPKATELPGTDGARRPFFSPDGQWVGFQSDGPKLNKISVDGGAVISLASGVGAGLGVSWGEDGSIIRGSFDGLWRIPAGGGPPETIAGPGNGELGLAFPQILPGGKAILFAATALGWDIDRNTIEVLTLADRHRKTVARGGQHPRYLPPSNGATSGGVGHLIYVNKATLFAIPFDLDKLETRGTAVPILHDVAYRGLNGAGVFDLSGTGTLVYRRGSGVAFGTTTVQWVDPTGRKEPLRATPGIYQNVSLSPDGKRVALMLTAEGSDIWVYDPQRDAMTRLTFGGDNNDPTWSPDGQYIVFYSFGGKGMFQARADGAGQPHALTQSSTSPIPRSFTPDGKRLAYEENTGQIWTVPLEDQGGQLKAGKPEQFLKSSSRDGDPSFSPDGRWLAYRSNESGKDEVYVRAFPPPSSGQGGKWQISNNGGTQPRWSRNGHELLYKSGNQIMAASYTVKGDTFAADKPTMWIPTLGATPSDFAIIHHHWDLAPDGKRVAVLTLVEAPKQEHEVVLLLNFSDELRRKAPL